MTKFFTELFNYFFIIQLPTVWWKIKSKFFWSAFSSHQLGMKIVQIQVNLCQNLVFLHQLTNNMTTNFSLNYKFNTWKFQAQNMGRTCCVLKLFLTFRTIHLHNMFSQCSAKIRASDKDLPVWKGIFIFYILEQINDSRCNVYKKSRDWIRIDFFLIE